MRHLFILLLLISLAIINIKPVLAQDKYEIKQTKFYLYDKSGHIWNDANAFVGVRLDATKNEGLEDKEISAGTISYSIGNDYQKYALKYDAAGSCIAEVPFIVYKDNEKPIYYEITLLKKEGDKYSAVALSNRSVAATKGTPERFNTNVTIFRPMLLNDWLFYGAIMLVSMLLSYFLFFRWLFSVLLFSRNWPVSRAEYFTTSLSLFVLLAVFAFLLGLFLPQTPVMWAVLSILAVFWGGHMVTWALSSNNG